LLNAKGWTFVMIAQAMLVHESTIPCHIKDFFDSVLPNTGARLSGRINDKFQKFYLAPLMVMGIAF